jgi:glycosyltransferase 2 family protein
VCQRESYVLVLESQPSLYDELRIPSTSRVFKQRLRQWRPVLSHIATVLILAALAYWGWQNRLIMQQVCAELGTIRLMSFGLLLTLGVVLSALSFTILVRSMGYQFTYRDGYHSLNLSQIAAMVPGKIWGFAGLAGLLSARGIPNRDSVLVISLHTLLTLSAAVFVGTCSLIPLLGWAYTLLCLVPVMLLLAGRSWCETLRSHFFMGSSPLPSSLSVLCMLIVGVVSWAVVSTCFALLVYSAAGRWPASPLLVASAFAAGYVGGFASFITPSGLGVREGIITVILGPALGSDKTLALAVVFRIVHMAVLWLHIAITLCALSGGRRMTDRGTH